MLQAICIKLVELSCYFLSQPTGLIPLAKVSFNSFQPQYKWFLPSVNLLFNCPRWQMHPNQSLLSTQTESERYNCILLNQGPLNPQQFRISTLSRCLYGGRGWGRYLIDLSGTSGPLHRGKPWVLVKPFSDWPFFKRMWKEIRENWATSAVQGITIRKSSAWCLCVWQ